MAVNRERKHILVLPEDRANRELASGFFLDASFSNRRTCFQVLREVGGWNRVLDSFKSVHIVEMNQNPNRFMVLLIDFDGKANRLDLAKAAIPDDLIDRVFVLGVWSEPEGLRSAKLGSYETIGLALAKDCREDRNLTWDHDLLRHNASELVRLREQVRPILFGPN